MKKFCFLAALICCFAIANTASAQLSGISIGNLGLGDSANGNNGASPDLLNGPLGFGTGSWSGGDDIYTIILTGTLDGTGELLLEFTHANGDLDLMLWNDDGATSLFGSSTSVDDDESIDISGLGPGTYYAHIDGWLGASNDYTISVNGNYVIPEPATASLCLLAVAGAGMVRRRRS